jgi:hypothetical protein
MKHTHCANQSIYLLNIPSCNNTINDYDLLFRPSSDHKSHSELKKHHTITLMQKWDEILRRHLQYSPEKENGQWLLKFTSQCVNFFLWNTGLVQGSMWAERFSNFSSHVPNERKVSVSHFGPNKQSRGHSSVSPCTQSYKIVFVHFHVQDCNEQLLSHCVISQHHPCVCCSSEWFLALQHFYLPHRS